MSGATVESIFGEADAKRKRAAVNTGVNPEPTLCIYFGAGRINRVRDRAKTANMTISGYVCHMVDAADLGTANVERLNTLAKLRGKSVSAVLAELLRAVG
jgi:hypothetical protein